MKILAACGLLTTLVLARDSAASDDTLTLDKVLVTLVDQAEVPAEAAGVVRQLMVKEGTFVNAGDVLARQDAEAAELAAAQAEVDMRQAELRVINKTSILLAEKALELAEAELARNVRSAEKYPKSVSDSEIDRRRLLVDQARLQLEQANVDWEAAKLAHQSLASKLEAAKREVQRRTIVAPIAGMVVQVYRRNGEWIDPGQPVVRILRTNRLRAEALLPADSVPPGMVGRSAGIRWTTAAGKQRELPGQIVFVSPELNAVDGQVRVWAEFVNPQGSLRPGMHVTVKIEGK